MGYDQYTRPVHKKTRWHLSGIQMVGLSGIQIVIKTGNFGIQPLFNHLNTKRVWYSDPHCISVGIQIPDALSQQRT